MLKLEFATQSHAGILQLAKEKIKISREQWEINLWQFLISWLDPSIHSITLSTSGSTGVPKMITHTKGAMANSAKMTCEKLNLKAGENALLCLPTDKIGGMMMVVRSVLNRMNLYCIKPSTTPIKHLEGDVHIDFAAFTPSQYHEIIDNYDSYKTAEKITKTILGGEDIHGNLLRLIRLMENEVYAAFGMTETISHIALKRLNGPKPVEFYKLLPGIKFMTD